MLLRVFVLLTFNQTVEFFNRVFKSGKRKGKEKYSNVKNNFIKLTIYFPAWMPIELTPGWGQDFQTDVAVVRSQGCVL